MRFTTKIVFIALLADFAATAQKPVGVTGLVGNSLDYYAVRGGNPDGDTYYFTAWAANSMLSLFPDPAGLPVVGTLNDGHAGGCGGNIELVQLSKLPSPFDTATTSNTLITPYTNCLASFGTGPGAVSAPTGWAGQLTGGDGRSDGTWKGAVMAFRNGILLAPVYRQPSAGGAFGDSTMILSPDAGQTWIDYGRYQTYAVTGASCSGTTVTLNATNALSAGQKIYVHDVAPSGYNGKATLTAATGSTVQYIVGSCPGTYTSSGAFGILSSDGSAPFGPGDASYPADMMWIGNGVMGIQNIIVYGQDGNYPSGIEPACDPTVYVCGVSFTKGTATYPMYLYRVPIGQEMNKSLYQWYSCPGYSALWPIADTVCDGNLAGSWTSTMNNATVLVTTRRWGNGARPGECFGLRYLPSHGAYLLSCLQESYPYAGSRIGFYWAPRPWGPYYPTYNSSCTESGSSCSPAFVMPIPIQENVISAAPPLTQLRLSANASPGTNGVAGGYAVFSAVEVGSGKVPIAGMARRGDWLGGFGYTGMGHRFVSGNMAGGISRRGRGTNGAYLLDWWTDLWDHGGDANATQRPWFRDLLSQGTKYVSTSLYDAGVQTGFTHGLHILADGIQIDGGYVEHLESNWVDSVFSANSGNSSWTYISVFKKTASGWGPLLNSPPPVNDAGQTQISIGTSRFSAGDIHVGWGPKPDATHVGFLTAGGVVALNTWYFLAISAESQASGFPIIRMYLGNAGTITEFGGVNMALSPNGTTGGGLTKACPVACTSTPAIASGVLWFGSNNFPYSPNALGGIYGEAGLYAGVVPGHVIREIYRTLRTDWARVGRGTL